MAAWAPTGFFSRGGQWGGLIEGQKSPLGSRGKAPETDDIFLKWCINTLYSKNLDNICSTKTLYNISREKRGQMPPMPIPMPAGAHERLATLRPNQTTWALSSPLGWGCYHPHPSWLFSILILFYSPTEGRRLSWLRHCSWGCAACTQKVKVKVNVDLYSALWTHL